MADSLKSRYSAAEFDSVRIRGLDSTSEPLEIESDMTVAKLDSGPGGRLLIRPFSTLVKSTDPFREPVRSHPVVFNYAREDVDTLTIHLPAKWRVETVPVNAAFSNQVGSFDLKWYNQDSSVSIHLLRRLDKAYWNEEMYQAVQEFFEKEQSMENLTLVLRPSK